MELHRLERQVAMAERHHDAVIAPGGRHHGVGQRVRVDHQRVIAGRDRRIRAAGEDAPKSRSWKSGFLKKRATSIEVVDSANRLGLPTHVGQRVTVTGVLLNKEMRARAVQRVGVCS